MNENIFTEYFNVLRFKADMIDAPSQQLNRAMIVAFMAHVQHLLTLNGFGNRRLQFKDLRYVDGELSFRVPDTDLDVVVDHVNNELSIWEVDRRIGDTLTTGLVKEFWDWLEHRTVSVSDFKTILGDTEDYIVINKAVQLFYGTDDPAHSMIWLDSWDPLLDTINDLKSKQN